MSGTQRRLGWVRIGVVVVALLLAGAAWKWTGLREWADPDRLVSTFEPYRTSWLAFPALILIFVVAELFLFPVLVLLFATGVVFGPWLGTLYGLTGALASAIPPFLIGRRVGRERLERFGGAVMRKIAKVLDRRGLIAVFLVRKIPAPYSLVNLACGASPVSMRDFLLGTLLGMGTGVVLITVVGSQIADILRDPEPGQIALAVVLLLIPVTIAIFLQRWFNRRVGVQR
jgi:phospholipase D1/2